MGPLVSVFWWIAWAAVWALASCQECKPRAFVDSIIPRKFWSGHHMSLKYGNSSDYQLLRRLGKGTFGEAYLAMNTHTDVKSVIKIYSTKSSHVSMIQEVLVLQTVCGGPNIVKLYDVIKEQEHGHPAIVMEFVQSSDADVTKVYQNLSPTEVRHYMQQLFAALAHVHKMEIIHRDVKPHNALIDTDQKVLRLIDFGLALFYESDLTNRSLAGTKHFQAPEMLVHYRDYDYMVDVWSCGVVFGSLILRKFPFFVGNSSRTMLGQIISLLGSDDLIAWTSKLGKSVNASVPPFNVQTSRRPLQDWAQPGSEPYATREALDLLNHLLRWDPHQRLSAKNALEHPYFASTT